MFRMTVAATGLLLGGAAMAQSNDQPPTPISGLEVSIYSGTAAGLKWRRATDDRGVRGYEVFREGELIGEFDALSFIVSDLVPGSLNNFSVISVDTVGQRSNASVGITFSTPGGPQAVVRPMTPSLRAAVYSGTAAGLAWTRPSDPSVVGQRVARYEVRRDGVLVSTTQTTSYIDTTLEGGRTYEYELTAIDTLGVRSVPARITVTTPGSGGGGDAVVAAPTGLRAVVYSSTAGAIAWDRAATPGLRYEVLRDGTSLGVVDATSYVESGLARGQSYAYEVIAIDRQGRRSAASRVTLRTPGAIAPPPASDNPFAEPDPAGGTTLARLGYPGARDLATDLVSAGYLESYLEVDATVTALITAGDGANRRVADCPGGGIVRNGGDVGVGDVVLEFDGCVVEERTLSGTVTRVYRGFPTAGGGTQTLTISFDALHVDAGEMGTLAVTGSFVREKNTGQDDRCIRFERKSDTISIVSARLERDGDVTSISEASYSQTDAEFVFGFPDAPLDTPCSTTRTLTVEGATSLVSTRFGGGTTTISTRGEVARDSAGEDLRTVPVLAADFGDGSTLTLTATSGTEAQVDIVSDGAAVSFTDDYAFEQRPYGIPLR